VTRASFIEFPQLGQSTVSIRWSIFELRGDSPEGLAVDQFRDEINKAGAGQETAE
jgi:hypothetical protein